MSKLKNVDKMNVIESDHETFQSVEKMTKDVKDGAITLSDTEARFLVDTYYVVQKNRIRIENQIRSIQKPWKDWKTAVEKIEKNIETNSDIVETLSLPIEVISVGELKKILNMDDEKKSDRFMDMYIDKDTMRSTIEKKKTAIVSTIEKKKEELEVLKKEEPIVEPHQTLQYFLKNYKYIEDNIKKCLGIYSMSKPIGKWMNSIVGIGPVISAGLMAHIDIHKVQTAGQIMAFGGIDPTKTWEEGQKRPWNASLKTLFWKIGQSFIKTANMDSDVYGKIYKIRKEYEMKKNEKGDYAEQAIFIGKTRKFKTDAGRKMRDEYYLKGKLPPSHITARSARYATKIFVSHLFSVWYELEFNTKPPKPYPIAILNHAHEIPIPNWKNE